MALFCTSSSNILTNTALRCKFGITDGSPINLLMCPSAYSQNSTMVLPINLVDNYKSSVEGIPMAVGLVREVSHQHVNQDPVSSVGRQTSIDKGPNYTQISSQDNTGPIV